MLTTIRTADPIEEYTMGFARGDRESFEYFVNELTAPLTWKCTKIVNDQAIAEDIVSESFIKIWERRADFDHSLVIKSWLYTTVTNAGLSYLAKAKREVKNVDMAGKIGDQYETSVDEDIDKRETVAAISRFLEYLPTECGRIFKHLYVDGLSVRETADVLGIQISTVKNQKARGLDIIRKKMSVTIAESKKKVDVKTIEDEKPVEIEIPEQITMKYLKKNAELLKLILPTMSPLRSYLVDLYSTKTEKYIRKSVPRSVSCNYDRTAERVLRDVQARLVFLQKYPTITKEIKDAMCSNVKNLTDSNKDVLASAMVNNTIDEIISEFGFSFRTVKNYMKNIVSALARPYPHPTLLSRSIPVEEKLQKIFLEDDGSILTAIKNSGALARKVRIHGNADGKSRDIISLYNKGKNWEYISAVVHLPIHKCKQRVNNYKYPTSGKKKKKVPLVEEVNTNTNTNI
jgi:RNA polymerase sigma factor (sigma-70 family)